MNELPRTPLNLSSRTILNTYLNREKDAESETKYEQIREYILKDIENYNSDMAYNCNEKIK
jgi:hypothetical protein